MAQRLSMSSDFPEVRKIEPAAEVETVPQVTPNPWYNDLSHDITDSTVFRCLLILVVFDHVWRWFND